MSWKRKWFFFVDKLKITPAERISIAWLCVFLGVLATANYLITPKMLANKNHYASLKAEFLLRSNALETKERALMARYNPDATILQDTLPQPDSTKKDSIDSKPQPASNKINVNTADSKALQMLTGIGPAYAQRIIDYRNTYGAFKNFEDLLKIKGIGKKRLEKIKPFIKLRE